MELIVLTESQLIGFFTKKPPTKCHKTNSKFQERLSKKSFNEVIFDIAKCEHGHVLKKSEFKVDSKYEKNHGQKLTNRSRNIICLNLPFTKAVSTNAAENFSSIDQQIFSKVSYTT